MQLAAGSGGYSGYSPSVVVTIWSRRPVESSFDEIARNNRVKMLYGSPLPSLSLCQSNVFLCVLRLLTLSRFASSTVACERPKASTDSTI